MITPATAAVLWALVALFCFPPSSWVLNEGSSGYFSWGCTLFYTVTFPAWTVILGLEHHKMSEAVIWLILSAALAEKYWLWCRCKCHCKLASCAALISAALFLAASIVVFPASWLVFALCLCACIWYLGVAILAPTVLRKHQDD